MKVLRTRGLGLSALAVAVAASAMTTAGAAAGAAASGVPRSGATAPADVRAGRLAVPLQRTPSARAAVTGRGPGYADCAPRKFLCYNPQQLRAAYGLTALATGAGGAGQTVVVVDSFGSPTVAADLARFDADYHLPAPPSLRVLAPLGSVAFDPKNGDQVGWAEETSLDVQWAHALAPHAGIVLMTSPVSETEGVQGLPQFLRLEEYAVDHHLGNVISQSWGATENTLFTRAGRRVIREFDAFYRRANAHGVTFLAATGDSGSANVDVNGDNYPFPTVGFPASSPGVTAVGGTSLYADASGRYLRETVWNDGPADATGGGVSQVEREPRYQRRLPAADQRLLRGHRGLPDVAFNADPNTAVPVYLGFLGAHSGYYFFGGTSEGAPAWAGIVADLDQQAGFPLGNINPGLYALGAAHLTDAFLHDITVGNNSQPPIPGYAATPGWDPVTGWGTPNFGRLGGRLAQDVRAANR